MPFVNDLKNILELVKNLGDDISASNYEFKTGFKKSIPDTYNVEGTILTQGTVDLSVNHEAAIWLDRLGFHPDIGTAWDLVPLSFVVDWILPVGDFLSSLHTRGWVRQVRFNGWRSIKYKGYAHIGTRSEDYVFRGDSDGPIPISGYYRDRLLGYIDVHSKTPEDFDLLIPSLKQMFNMFYIFILSRKTNL